MTVVTKLRIGGVLIAQCGQPTADFDINDVLVIVKETEHRKKDKLIAVK